MDFGPTKKLNKDKKEKKTGWAKPKKRPGTNLTNKKRAEGPVWQSETKTGTRKERKNRNMWSCERKKT